MKRACVLLASFVACAHDQVRSPDEWREENEHHPCDPTGADVARFEAPKELSASLSREELELRGTCDSPNADRYETRRPSEVASHAMTDVFSHRCSGDCEPMRAKLPAFDEQHDLEDAKLLDECAAAVKILPAKIRASCGRVCVVDRREQAAHAIFARVFAGLFALEGHIPDHDAGDAEIRATWRASKAPLPPARFHFSATAKTTVSAMGELYPGGPVLKLRLIEGDAGCDQSQWTVLAW